MERDSKAAQRELCRRRVRNYLKRVFEFIIDIHREGLSTAPGPRISIVLFSVSI